MNIKKAFVVGILSFFLICGAFLIALKGLTPSRGIWKDYEIVLASSRISEKELIDSMTSFLSPHEILSPSRSFIEINNFSGNEKVAVKDLANRFDPKDPRFDSYLQNISRYFYTPRGWQVFYFKPSGNYFSLFQGFLQLQKQFPGDLIIPFFDPLEKVMLFLIILVMGIFILRFKEWQGFCFPGFLLIIVWLPYLFSGSLYRGISFYILVPVFLSFLKESCLFFENKVVFSWIKSKFLLRKGGAFLFALLLVGFLNKKLGIQHYPLFPLIGQGVLGMGYLIFYLARRMQRSHRFFRRVSLKQTKGPVKNIGYIGILVLVISFIPLYYLNKLNNIDVTVPAPLNGDHRIADNNGSEFFLPGLRDYLKHKAFQENMPRGGQYGDLALVIKDHYLIDEGRIFQKEGGAFSFDKQWQKKVIAQIGENSVEKMLLSQGEEGLTAYQPLTVFLKKRYLMGGNWLYLGVYLPLIIFSLFLLLLYFYLTPTVLYGLRNLMIGRKHKAAL